MKTYYIKFLRTIFWTGKGLIIAFSMQSPIKGQDSFEKIEIDLHAVQEKAIVDIRKALPLIPEDKWQNALMNITLARKKTKKLLCADFKQAYYFQPKLDKKFTNQIISNPFICSEENTNQSSSFLNLKKDGSLDRFALLTRMCMAARNIKPGTVTVKSFSDEKKALAYAKTGPDMYEWSLFDWCFKLSQISKEQCIAINLLRLKKYFDSYSDKKYNVFQIDIVNHELTHLIEAHASTHGTLLRIAKEYYPYENLDNHVQFINLQKAHELTAEVVPRMLSFYSALLEEQKSYKAPSNIHPSSEDLKPWIKRIITCYENYYGTIAPSDKSAFFKSLK
jgi:hypothetical protein